MEQDPARIVLVRFWLAPAALMASNNYRSYSALHQAKGLQASRASYQQPKCVRDQYCSTLGERQEKHTVDMRYKR